MATFSSSKKVSEISEAVLLPEDWYLVRIVKEPKIVANNASKGGKSVADGGGNNWRITLRVQHENPEYHGRSMMISLPLPSDEINLETDKLVEEENHNSVSGRTIYDEKFERIARWCAAFSGYDYAEMGDEEEFELSPGSEAMIYINQAPSFKDNEVIVNNIDIFNSLPIKAE